MKTHTPGPWFAATGWVGAGKQPHPRVICRVDSYPYFDTEANIWLMAAAPELLDALKAVQMIINAHLCPFGVNMNKDINDCDCNYHMAARQAQAAIAKAEGKQHGDASQIRSGV